MHQLVRRVALGLTLPVVLGAPVALLAAPAHATGPTVSLSTSVEESIVYGQQVTATAQVVDGEEPVTAGSVQFYVGFQFSGSPGEVTPLGDRVPLDANGRATSPPLTQQDGRPFDVTDLYDSWGIQARYFDPAEQPTGEDTVGLKVARSASSLAVLPTATTLVADIAGALPGGAQENSFKPGGGLVEFQVDGQTVGAPTEAADGKATITYTLPSGTHTITASYAGDDRYEPSSESLSRKDPTLEARVLSMLPKSKSGWYHTAVDIWFICRPQGSELVEDCPVDVSLKNSGKNQSVTRTIHAIDGGSATITITGLDIDRQKPVITVDGRTCTATDKLSGVKGKCHMKIGNDGRYRAIAQDKAGNRAVKRGVLD